MSFLTIAIIIAIVLVILDTMEILINGFPDLGTFTLYGIIVDFITIAICIGIRVGWIGFFISAVILFFLFFGIDELQMMLHEKNGKRIKRRWMLKKTSY